MATRNRTTQQRRRRQPARTGPVDMWRPPEALPDVEPIVAPEDVGALLRSLGDPPTIGNAAAHYFTAVVERAAAIAVALALSADLPAAPPGTPTDS